MLARYDTAPIFLYCKSAAGFTLTSLTLMGWQFFQETTTISDFKLISTVNTTQVVSSLFVQQAKMVSLPDSNASFDDKEVIRA